MNDMVPLMEFIEYVKSRGYEATPITNCIAAVQDGVNLEIVAYELKGPRRGRAIVEKNKDGLLSIDRAALYCEGWDYSTRKIAERKARKELRKAR